MFNEGDIIRNKRLKTLHLVVKKEVSAGKFDERIIFIIIDLETSLEVKLLHPLMTAYYELAA